MNIPPEMPVDQVKEEEEPAKEVIATKVNLNKLSKPSSSHVYSDFCSKIPRIFANRQVGRVGVDLRSVGERHCEVVQRQVWVRIHQQERHQGRCVRPPGNAILTGQLFLMVILTNLLNQSYVLFQTAIIKNNPKKAVRSVGDGEVGKIIELAMHVLCKGAFTTMHSVRYHVGFCNGQNHQIGNVRGDVDLFVAEDHEPSCGFLVTLVEECARRTAQGSLAVNAGSQINL